MTILGDCMLSKLEALYLGLLRGFILIAASLALVASALLVVTTIPDILTRLGIMQSRPAPSSLSTFIAERRPQEQGANTDQAESKLPVDPGVHTAATSFKRYLRGKSTIDWEQGLQASTNQLPTALQDQYRKSLVTLSQELLTSKGKPLGERRVAELIDWHQKRFASTVEQQAQEQSAADAAFKFKMTAAFGALMLFIFIAFIFLFVRIERNLRTMRVTRVDDHA